MLTWILATAENRRLAEENQSLKKELAKAKQQLLAEIDSNRNREDSLIDAIVQIRTPLRKLLLPRNEQTDVEDLEELVFDDTTKAKPDLEKEREEQLVLARARDFAREYARRGIPVDFEDLCNRIREDPDEYLSN